MRYAVTILYAIVALITPAFGADYSFIGAFAQDDERRQFSFTLIQPGTVLITHLVIRGRCQFDGSTN
jgi:flagellar biosynthesis component FlhA